jgi:hypothetical protein
LVAFYGSEELYHFMNKFHKQKDTNNFGGLTWIHLRK